MLAAYHPLLACYAETAVCAKVRTADDRTAGAQTPPAAVVAPVARLVKRQAVHWTGGVRRSPDGLSSLCSLVAMVASPSSP